MTAGRLAGWWELRRRKNSQRPLINQWLVALDYDVCDNDALAAARAIRYAGDVDLLHRRVLISADSASSGETSCPRCPIISTCG